MLRTMQQTAAANPHADPALKNAVESRAMTLGGILLIGAISMQFAIFAVVLIGGHRALVAIGASMSWLTYEFERIGGSLAMPLGTCVFLMILGALLLALDRTRWIVLPRRVHAGTAYALRVIGSTSVLFALGYLT